MLILTVIIQWRIIKTELHHVHNVYWYYILLIVCSFEVAKKP